MEGSSKGGYQAKKTKSVARLNYVEKMEDEEMSNAESGGPPDGFQYVLFFLDLASRLNVERVNKRLREAVKDPLAWIDLKVEGPACRRLTKKILLKLVKRADGHLKSIFLVDAHAITNKTLRKISERNPGLERISIPGCTRVKTESFVRLVEAHSLKARAKGLPGIRQAHFAGLKEISPEHLVRISNALKISGLPQNEVSPSYRYYGNEHGRIEAIDKRAVDVELCPDCKRVALIYDCVNHMDDPEGACLCVRSEDEELCDSECGDECTHGKPCRSCIHCIPRCKECGGCGSTVYPAGESVCSDLLCIDCYFRLPEYNNCSRPSCSLHEEDCFPYGGSYCAECYDEVD